jgi:hypothetical protein
MNEDQIKLILLKKYVEGEITLEKYDKLMEVMQPVLPVNSFLLC